MTNMTSHLKDEISQSLNAAGEITFADLCDHLATVHPAQGEPIASKLFEMRAAGLVNWNGNLLAQDSRISSLA
jgi:hypothetical protein